MAIAHRATSTDVLTSAGTSLSVPKPSGLANDDVVYAWICNGGAAVAPSTVPTGFTLLGSALASPHAGFLYRKVITNAAGEPANYSWVFAASDEHVAIMGAYSGVDQTTPEDVAAAFQSNPSTLHTCPSVVTVSADAWILCGHFTLDGTEHTWAITERADVASDFTSSGRSATTADEQRPSQGATGTKTVNPGSDDDNATFTVAMRPGADNVISGQASLGGADRLSASLTQRLTGASLSSASTLYANGYPPVVYQRASLGAAAQISGPGALLTSETLQTSPALMTGSGDPRGQLVYDEPELLHQDIHLRLVVGRDDWSSIVDEGLSFTSVDPGGYETATFSCPRDMELLRGTNVRIESGLSTAWEGRVSEIEKNHDRGTVRTVVACEGYGAVLKERLWSMIWVDRDLSAWQGPSREYEIEYGDVGRTVTGPEVMSDTKTGLPALLTRVEGAWVAVAPSAVGVYDAGDDNKITLIGCTLVDMFGNVAAGTDAMWHVEIAGANDDSFASFNTSGDLKPGGSRGFSQAFGPTGHRYIAVRVNADQAPGGEDAKQFDVKWRQLAVYGDTGLTVQAFAESPAGGFYTSDIVRAIIERGQGEAAPGYSAGLYVRVGYLGRAGASLPINHLVHKDPTSLEKMIEDCATWEGWHYGVWEHCSTSQPGPDSRLSFGISDPRLWYVPRPISDQGYSPRRPTTWARLADCSDIALAERLGDLYNIVKVRYTDPGGSSRLVTRVWPGELAAGITLAVSSWARTIEVDGGTLTLGSAERLGDLVLAEAKAHRRSAGQITLPTEVQVNRGSMPAYQLKPGIDALALIDAATPYTSLTAEKTWQYQELDEPSREQTYGVRRQTTTVDRNGPRTVVELERGLSLVETLQARLDVAAVTVLGGR